MKKLSHIFRQCRRGSGTLPHVGDHPGTVILFAFIIMGALAGAKGGWAGCLGGAFIMGVFITPLYLIGAYDRAELSDRLQGL